MIAYLLIVVGHAKCNDSLHNPADNEYDKAEVYSSLRDVNRKIPQQCKTLKKTENVDRGYLLLMNLKSLAEVSIR